MGGLISDLWGTVTMHYEYKICVAYMKQPRWPYSQHNSHYWGQNLCSHCENLQAYSCCPECAYRQRHPWRRCQRKITGMLIQKWAFGRSRSWGWWEPGICTMVECQRLIVSSYQDSVSRGVGSDIDSSLNEGNFFLVNVWNSPIKLM